jgi:hypothetical protein
MNEDEGLTIRLPEEPKKNFDLRLDMTKVNKKTSSSKKDKSPADVQDINKLFNYSSRPNNFGIAGRNNFLSNSLNFGGSHRAAKK